MKTKLLRKIRSRFNFKYVAYISKWRGFDESIDSPYWQFSYPETRRMIHSALLRIYSYKKVQKLTSKWGKNY